MPTYSAEIAANMRAEHHQIHGQIANTGTSISQATAPAGTSSTKPTVSASEAARLRAEASQEASSTVVPEVSKELPEQTKEQVFKLPFFMRAIGFYDAADGPISTLDKWEHDFKWTRCYHAYCLEPQWAEIRDLKFVDLSVFKEEGTKVAQGLAIKEEIKEQEKEEKKGPVGDNAHVAIEELVAQLNLAESLPSSCEEGAPKDKPILKCYVDEAGVKYMSADGYFFFAEDEKLVTDTDYLVYCAELTDDQVTTLLKELVLGNAFSWLKVDRIIHASRLYARNALSDAEFADWNHRYDHIRKVRATPARFDEAAAAPGGIANMRQALNDLLLWVMALDQRWNVRETDVVFGMVEVEVLTLLAKGKAPGTGLECVFLIEVDMTEDRFAAFEEQDEEEEEEEGHEKDGDGNEGADSKAAEKHKKTCEKKIEKDKGTRATASEKNEEAAKEPKPLVEQVKNAVEDVKQAVTGKANEKEEKK